ncbi:MAG: poly(3-hydroxyalkanoate) granule-associated protein PhaI [Gammaproteobacteria bacterium HGW-Gammaproteobacteria-6]|nr:MAG: poly(3-hydroxyalkanoate) granule-associated protein PhaI [Gammaproteobacteria bacterium HGW-Gammaproteobacteria-6]
MATAKKETLIDSGVNLVTEVADGIKTQSRQFWLAGLGAYAKAGKDSLEYFKDLVAEGEVLEKQGKELISEQVETATSKLESLKGRFHEMTGGRLEKVASELEERRSAVLARFGIPTSSEMSKLSAKIDQLTATLKKAS